MLEIKMIGILLVWLYKDLPTPTAISGWRSLASVRFDSNISLVEVWNSAGNLSSPSYHRSALIDVFNVTKPIEMTIVVTDMHDMVLGEIWYNSTAASRNLSSWMIYERLYGNNLFEMPEYNLVVENQKVKCSNLSYPNLVYFATGPYNGTTRKQFIGIPKIKAVFNISKGNNLTEGRQEYLSYNHISLQGVHNISIPLGNETWVSFVNGISVYNPDNVNMTYRIGVNEHDACNISTYYDLSYVYSTFNANGTVNALLSSIRVYCLWIFFDDKVYECNITLTESDKDFVVGTWIQIEAFYEDLPTASPTNVTTDVNSTTDVNTTIAETTTDHTITQTITLTNDTTSNVITTMEVDTTTDAITTTGVTTTTYNVTTPGVGITSETNTTTGVTANINNGTTPDANITSDTNTTEFTATTQILNITEVSNSTYANTTQNTNDTTTTVNTTTGANATTTDINTTPMIVDTTTDSATTDADTLTTNINTTPMIVDTTSDLAETTSITTTDLAITALLNTATAVIATTMDVVTTDVNTTPETGDTTTGVATMTSLSTTTDLVTTTSIQTTTEIVTTVAVTNPTTCQTCTCTTSENKYAHLANLTYDQLVEALKNETERLRNELLVDTTTLSSTVRKKTSAKDSRKSAVSIGYVGFIILITEVVLLIAGDIPNFQTDLAWIKPAFWAIVNIFQTGSYNVNERNGDVESGRTDGVNQTGPNLESTNNSLPEPLNGQTGYNFPDQTFLDQLHHKYSDNSGTVAQPNG